MERQIVKTGEGTWRIEDGFVRFFVLAGASRALVIDSGVSGPGARKLAESLTDLPLTLVNTHGDGDHTAGNGDFSTYYINEADAAACAMAEKFPGSVPQNVSDGDVFDLGGRVVEVIAIPGHTVGSVALLDSASRTLYSGDSVQDGHIYLFGPQRDPERLEASLEKLTAMTGRFDRICPSHGTPELAPDYAGRVLAAWREVRAGRVEPHPETLHGRAVRTFDTPDCGFYWE